MIMMVQMTIQPIAKTHKRTSSKRHPKSTAYHFGDPSRCTCTNSRRCRHDNTCGTALEIQVDIMDTSTSRPSLSQKPLVLQLSGLLMGVAVPVYVKNTTEAARAERHWRVKRSTRMDLGTLMLKCFAFVHGCSAKKKHFYVVTQSSLELCGVLIVVVEGTHRPLMYDT